MKNKTLTIVYLFFIIIAPTLLADGDTGPVIPEQMLAYINTTTITVTSIDSKEKNNITVATTTDNKKDN